MTNPVTAGFYCSGHANRSAEPQAKLAEQAQPQRGAWCAAEWLRRSIDRAIDR